VSGRGNLHVVAVGEDAADLTRIARQISATGAEIEDEALTNDEHFVPYRPFGPKSGEDGLEVMDFRSLAGDAETVDLRVREGAAVAGKTLRDAGEEGFLDDLLLLAVEQDEETLNPMGTPSSVPVTS